VCLAVYGRFECSPCSVLQCVEVYCRVLQSVAVRVAVYGRLECSPCSVFQSVVVRCSVLQCVLLYVGALNEDLLDDAELCESLYVYE